MASGELLFEKGDARPHAIASLTKLLALRVIWKHNLDLAGSTTMIKTDYLLTKGGARSRLRTGHAYRHEDLVHAALLGSDNRAVVALGRGVGLDAKALVAAMNDEAKALGLQHTKFIDPTGIDHGNQATAAEVVAMLRAVSDIPALAAVTRKKTWQTGALERSGRPLAYRNTNLLVHHETRKVLVGKTGFNSAAGWCVASVIQLRNGRRVAIAVIGSSGKYMRFRDARKLESWAARQPYAPVKAAVDPAASPRVQH